MPHRRDAEIALPGNTEKFVKPLHLMHELIRPLGAAGCHHDNLFGFFWIKDRMTQRHPSAERIANDDELFCPDVRHELVQ